MVINTNLSAMSSSRLLTESSNKLSKSLSRLSSGSKITSPEDDAAGMAVSMKFDAQASRIVAAQNNVNNAISFSQTQDGFLQKVSNALDRMSELAVLAQDATKTTMDDALYQAEFTKLQSYIQDVATKKFNGVSLFSNTGLEVTTDPEKLVPTTLTAVDLTTGVLSQISHWNDVVSSATLARETLVNVKSAISYLAEARSNVGANISTLNSYNTQLGVLRDNISAANSRIKDVDVAEESAHYAQYNILVQAGTAMLAQANQAPQQVLKLLQ